MATITVAMETANNRYSGNQSPDATNTYDLGESQKKWRTVFAENLFIQGKTIRLEDLLYKGSPNGDPLFNKGGMMYGPLGFKADQWAFTSGSNPVKAYAMDLKNSDIIGANSILFNGDDGSTDEGICFPKTGRNGSSNKSDYDILRAKDGVLYFNGTKVAGGGSDSSEGGSLGKGDWSITGQELRVHGKRALVGTREGVLSLGYGSDFTTFKCGDNTIWHTGNLNSNTDFKVGTLATTKSYITIGNRKLYIQDSAPSGVPDGTIWIK